MPNIHATHTTTAAAHAVKPKKTAKSGGKKFDAFSFIKNLAVAGTVGFGIFSLFNGGLFKAADPNNYLKVAANTSPFYYPTFPISQQPITGTPDDLPDVGTPTQLLNIPFGGNPVFNPRNILTDALTNFFPWDK